MDPVSGVGPPGSNEQARATRPSEVRASLIQAPDSLTRAASGWFDALAVRRLPDGSFAFRTELGEASVRLPEGVSIKLGTAVHLRLDGDGQVSLRIRPEQVEARFILPQPSAPAPAQLREAPLVAFSLLEALTPVRPGLAAPAGQSEAAQSVLSLLPHAGSGAFALAAALYPQIMRSGEFSRLLAQSKDTSGIRNASRLLERIEGIASAPAPRMEGSNGWLGWQLPFWDGSALRESRWLVKPDEPSDEDLPRVHQALVEMNLPTLGRIQIHCMADGELWDFTVITERALPEYLRGELAAGLSFATDLLKLSARIGFQVGEENFLPVRAD